MLPICHERMSDILDYDKETGVFTWKIKASKKTIIGSEAGCPTAYGYVRIKIDGITYAAHRLAWFYINRSWPCGQIDHINGVRTDNRAVNLRDVSRSINQQNQRASQRGNKSGLLGVSWSNKDKKWWSRISVNGKFNYLGSYDSPEDAHAAYVAAKRQMHEGCTI